MSAASETVGFQFNHTMIRVKDPKASIKFYTEVLGMELVSRNENSDFTLYFLAYDHSGGTISAEQKKRGRFTREGVLELTHNHGTENNPHFSYANGNTEPHRGFGHIAITVPDIEKACERFETLGVDFKKRLTDGKMRNIAFILDPDGYWVEIVPATFRL
ncbi:glyoxalase I [Fistulina hepatica ATCC 64428]|uniref:Lactoylglutathione lyase n=1 Tax=Fistulina hepatica ATCC 64428 TaxID=1128425 RepID=A0A0D7AHB9_9AGAR|nr:glyoxalase I [Fistulina hepatica ATCC 64428]